MSDLLGRILVGAIDTVVENIITDSPYLARQHIHALVERVRELEAENAQLKMRLKGVHAQLSGDIGPAPPSARPNPPGDPWAIPTEREERPPSDKENKDGRYR